MSESTFGTFQDAYLTELRRTFHEPEFRNSPRGFTSSERIGVSFRLLDPIQRHISLPARRANLVFNFAEALWYLSGSNELDFIGYYAGSIAKYSADGKTLQGTAYGPRIFDHGGLGLNQWHSVVDTLTEDRDSKRAVLQIFDGRELVIPDNIDVACTLGLQYMIRDDRLCGVGYMRANDAFRGMVSDVFSFTLLLELMARQLGLEVGSYTHLVGTLHVYDTDRDWAGRVLSEAEVIPEPPGRFPAMPDGDNWPHIREVLDLEARLRADKCRLDADAIRSLDLPDYWKHVVTLFEAYRQVQHKTALSPDVTDALPELYQSAVRTRWPKMFGRAESAEPREGGLTVEGIK